MFISLLTFSALLVVLNLQSTDHAYIHVCLFLYVHHTVQFKALRDVYSAIRFLGMYK